MGAKMKVPLHLLLILLLTSATAFRVSRTKVMKLKELKPKFPTPPGQLCLYRQGDHFIAKIEKHQIRK